MKQSLPLFLIMAMVYGLHLYADESIPGIGVRQIRAGTNITLSPGDGRGEVEISAAAAAAGGDNQAVNTATMTWVICKGGGAVFLATSSWVSIPGCMFDTGTSTIQVTEVRAWTMTPSTALDGNTKFNLKVATTTNVLFGPGNWFHRASSVSVISSSDTTIEPIRYSNWQSTGFAMNPGDYISVDISSVPSGGAPLAENWGYEVRGWKRP